MARGPRAPSQNAYRGTIGQTQTETVHVTNPRGDLMASTVYTTIDAVSDPDLVERLYAGTLNSIKVEGGAARELAVPVIYHDPAAELVVLVLGEAHRHREIEERIRLLERLREDESAIPAYVKDFAVVFGAKGLRGFLEEKAQQALKDAERSTEAELARPRHRTAPGSLVDAGRQDAKDGDRRRSDLHIREAELERARQEVEAKKAELKRKQMEHDASLAEMRRTQMELQRDRAELERMRAEARKRVIAAAVHDNGEETTIGPPPSGEKDDVITKPIGRHDDEIETMMQKALPRRENDFAVEPRTGFEVEPATGIDDGMGARMAGIPDFTDSERTGDDVPVPEITNVELDDEVTGTSSVSPGADSLSTETVELTTDPRDQWLDSVAKSATSTFTVQDGKPRLALVAGEQIANGLDGNVDVRMLLHRMSTYPLIVVMLGPPAALRTPSPNQLAVLPLDIGSESERAVLGALARRFELTVDIVLRGKSIRRVRLTAPLAENAAYILRAAEDHLRGITADNETEPSYVRARDLVLGAGYDLLAVEHPEAGEFRDDRLSQLETAQQVRRALATARRFTRPSREDYLICSRGYPLSRWRQLRRKVLEKAVAWGMWMGPELAQVAVSEGLARSRRDLILKLDAGFETLRRDQRAFDLDADAADDNRKAINEEAKALGVDLRRKGTNGAIKSEDVSVVSGSIERTPTQGLPAQRTTDELIAMLDDKLQRVAAATELCDRSDARAAPAVIAAVQKMSRAEAVRILGKSVKLGPAVAKPLIDGLSSSKAFLRHGCALALALLRTEDGTHAVIDLLLTEPTEIWREIARAIGQIGPTALMPLASHVGRLGDGVTAATQERVAWAMAHVGVRGGKSALDQMAAGQSVVAPIARKAVDLMSNAARDEVRVRDPANKDVTVNRAFSRRFFEALEADRPDVAKAALHDLEASGQLELLDEEDLIIDEDDEAELDESDLIQT